MYDDSDDILGDITEPFIREESNDHLAVSAYLFDDDWPAGQTSSYQDEDWLTVLFGILMDVGIVVVLFAPFIQKFYRGELVPLYDGIVRLVSPILG